MGMSAAKSSSATHAQCPWLTAATQLDATDRSGRGRAESLPLSLGVPEKPASIMGRSCGHTSAATPRKFVSNGQLPDRIGLVAGAGAWAAARRCGGSGAAERHVRCAPAAECARRQMQLAPWGAGRSDDCLKRASARTILNRPTNWASGRGCGHPAARRQTRRRQARAGRPRLVPFGLILDTPSARTSNQLRKSRDQRPEAGGGIANSAANSSDKGGLRDPGSGGVVPVKGCGGARCPR